MAPFAEGADKLCAATQHLVLGTYRVGEGDGGRGRVGVCKCVSV